MSSGRISINYHKIQQGNSRYCKELDGNLPAKVWKSIKELGIYGVDDEEAFEGITRNMETRDRENENEVLGSKMVQNEYLDFQYSWEWKLCKKETDQSSNGKAENRIMFLPRNENEDHEGGSGIELMGENNDCDWSGKESED